MENIYCVMGALRRSAIAISTSAACGRPLVGEKEYNISREAV